MKFYFAELLLKRKKELYYKTVTGIQDMIDKEYHPSQPTTQQVLSYTGNLLSVIGNHLVFSNPDL